MNETTCKCCCKSADTAKKGELEILQPSGKELVCLLSKMKMQYLGLPLEERIKKFADAGERGILGTQPNEPTPVLVSWKWTPGEDAIAPVFWVELSKRGANGCCPVAHRSARYPYVFFTNLEIAADYRLDVYAMVAGECVAHTSRDFTTNAMTPRMLSIPNVANARDVGGHIGMDGRRMKQGLVYRTAALNDNPEDIHFLSWEECRAEFESGQLRKRERWQANHMADVYEGKIDPSDWHRVPIADARGRERMTPESRRILLEDLGIRTDLDMRSEGEVAGMRQSPLGDHVKWAHIPFTAYNGLASDIGKGMVRNAFKVFLDKENYPIVFHCLGGQDRTGTFAYLLQALMGVNDDELAKDWECSGFTTPGNWFRHETLYNMIPEVINKYPGENTRERVEAYLRELGFTDADFAMLRDLLLEPAAADKDNV